MRYDDIVISASRAPGDFHALQHHVAQPTFREWVTSSDHTGWRAAGGAFSLLHFFPLASQTYGFLKCSTGDHHYVGNIPTSKPVVNTFSAPETPAGC
jgi:hypothetical protein